MSRVTQIARELAAFSSAELLAELERRKKSAMEDINAANDGQRLFRSRANTQRQLDQILDVVCANYGCTRTALIGEARFEELVEPRHVAMYLTRTLSGAGVTQIGRYFGKDHSTILYAFRNVQRRMANETPFKRKVETLAKRLAP